MSGVEDIINYKLDPDEDFYGLLGCDENSTVDQITTEYKALALQHHPDKNDGDKDAESKFQKLKEAKETLCDPARRAMYDKWRNSGISMSYKQWMGMKEHVQQSMHWATPRTKDRMLPGGAPPTTGGGAGRRASEGGARWGTNQAGVPPPEIVSKFRNYEI